MKKKFQFFRDIVASFLRNNCSLHAAGLTYFAMLAIIPVLCCILVAAKTCGVDRYARAQINEHIDAMISNVEKGQDDHLAEAAGKFASDEAKEKKRIAAEEFARQAREISNALFERINKFDISTFGWIGFGFLLWTVISSLGMVEVSFNHIWGVAKPRPVLKKSYTYLFILIVLPILAAIAMSAPVLSTVKDVIVATLGATWLTRWAGNGLIWLLDSLAFRLGLTLAFSSVLFGYLYWALPNCRVPWRTAWTGGLLTAVLFGAWVKICAVAQIGIAKSSALYGSFAILPIVLAWLYMSWQIILFGACFTCELQKVRTPAAAS